MADAFINRIFIKYQNDVVSNDSTDNNNETLKNESEVTILNNESEQEN